MSRVLKCRLRKLDTSFSPNRFIIQFTEQTHRYDNFAYHTKCKLDHAKKVFPQIYTSIAERHIGINQSSFSIVGMVTAALHSSGYPDIIDARDIICRGTEPSRDDRRMEFEGIARLVNYSTVILMYNQYHTMNLITQDAALDIWDANDAQNVLKPILIELYALLRTDPYTFTTTMFSDWMRETASKPPLKNKS